MPANDLQVALLKGNPLRSLDITLRCAVMMPSGCRASAQDLVTLGSWRYLSAQCPSKGLPAKQSVLGALSTRNVGEDVVAHGPCASSVRRSGPSGITAETGEVNIAKLKIIGALEHRISSAHWWCVLGSPRPFESSVSDIANVFQSPDPGILGIPGRSRALSGLAAQLFQIL